MFFDVRDTRHRRTFFQFLFEQLQSRLFTFRMYFHLPTAQVAHITSDLVALRRLEREVPIPDALNPPPDQIMFRASHWLYSGTETEFLKYKKFGLRPRITHREIWRCSKPSCRQRRCRRFEIPSVPERLLRSMIETLRHKSQQFWHRDPERAPPEASGSTACGPLARYVRRSTQADGAHPKLFRRNSPRSGHVVLQQKSVRSWPAADRPDTTPKLRNRDSPTLSPALPGPGAFWHRARDPILQQRSQAAHRDGSGFPPRMQTVRTS